MPAYQCQFWFFDQGKVFSETLYWSGAAMKDAMSALNELARLRAQLTGGQCSLGKLRVCRIPADRNVLEAPVPKGVNHIPSREPWEALVVDMIAQSGANGRTYQRGMSMRGLPAGYKDKTGNWLELLHKYLKRLVDLRFCIRVLDAEVPATPIAQISDFAVQNADSFGDPLNPADPNPAAYGMCFACAVPHGLPAVNTVSEDPVLVKILGNRWRLPSGEEVNLFPKPVKLLATIPNAFSVLGKLPTVGTLASPGKVRLHGIVYHPIVKCRARYDPRRKAGVRSKQKPSFLPPWDDQLLQASLREQFKSPLPATAPFLIPVEPVVPVPVVRELADAYELLKFVEEGYKPLPDGSKRNIRIARIVNLTNTWLVAASGTDSATSLTTGIPADIAAGAHFSAGYAGNIAQAMRDTIPSDHSIVYAGDSLGGMVVQLTHQSFDFVSGKRYTGLYLVTFNSPMTGFGTQPVHTQRFTEYGDAVIHLTAIGAIMAPIGHPEQTYIGEFVLRDPYTGHTMIYTDERLRGWDAVGDRQPDSVEGRWIMKLGEIHNFPSDYQGK